MLPDDTHIVMLQQLLDMPQVLAPVGRGQRHLEFVQLRIRIVQRVVQTLAVERLSQFVA